MTGFCDVLKCIFISDRKRWFKVSETIIEQRQSTSHTHMITLESVQRPLLSLLNLHISRFNAYSFTALSSLSSSTCFSHALCPLRHSLRLSFHPQISACLHSFTICLHDSVIGRKYLVQNDKKILRQISFNVTDWLTKLEHWKRLYSNTLNCTFIVASTNPKESILTPARPPTVLDSPVVDTTL